MKPYYDHAGIMIYHGDCREILPLLNADALITDPVWPNSHDSLQGWDRPAALLAEAMSAIPPLKRLLIWLGCASDPRILLSVPASYPFLRAVHLRRAIPGYNGRTLVTADIAYGFGEYVAKKPGRQVIPGECTATLKTGDADDRNLGHPTPRFYKHVEWVVGWWSDEGETVLDPFAGSGSTLVAAKNGNRKA